MNAPLLPPPSPLRHIGRLAPGDAIRVATAAGAIVLPLFLSGCGGGGGGGGGGGSAALTFTAITIEVAILHNPAAVVTVDGAPTDGSRKARFALNGSASLTTRAKDPGSKKAVAVYPFTATAIEGNTATSSCYVAINPALKRSLPPANGTVLQLKHLFNRLGFGATETEMVRFRHMPYNTVVDTILDEATIADTTQKNPAAATFQVMTWQEFNQLSVSEQNAHNDKKGDLLTKVYAWWWREMIRTRHPILERMALFWHNLLVVVASDIFEPKTVWGYLTLLRTHALGSYRDLIHGIARDPAMALFLDSNSNRKGRPNENFARELLELFTLGEGQGYTEEDVVETARCFTGWHVTDRHAFWFNQNQHDTSPKSVLGTPIDHPAGPDQAQLDGDAVLDIVLAENRVAVFICERLWDEFIGGTRDTGVIAGWATTFRNADYQIKPVLKAIFKHSDFTNAANRGNMLRSPVELHVAVFRTVGIEPNDFAGHHWQAAQEDQQLLSPPNVRGWIGGLTWVDAKTLLERRKHMQWLGWEFHNDNRQKIPERFDEVLETLWFATPIFDPAKVTSEMAAQFWDPRGARIRTLLVDPAIHCK